MWIAYGRSKGKTLLLVFAIVAIFWGTCKLYQLPMESFYYALSLVLALVSVAFLWEGYQWIKKYQKLESTLKEKMITLTQLPQATDLLERQYQQLLHRLLTTAQALYTSKQDSEKEVMDYFTLWTHQIKTPMFAMDLLMQREENSINQQLKEELWRIEQYVEMALMYVKLDSSASDYVINSYELDEIIKQGIREFSTQFIRKKITLTYEPVSYRVITDRKWLLFVLQQLLSNSLKYTAGGGNITITFKDGILHITDTGIGIAPEDVPRIFEKGFTGYHGRENQKATGLGLYLVKRICNALGHTISVQSLVGVGTTISIVLKRYDLEVE
ncbi:MAG: HAMP domain-containing histidine kinase [Clostridiales bacterium]|nr:HAMP domain-containing histidine kinase [Clostridiales bacterium]